MVIKIVSKNSVQYFDLNGTLLKRKKGIPITGFGLMLLGSPLHFFF